MQSLLVSDGEESNSTVISREDHVRVYCAPSDPPWIQDNLDKFMRGSLPIMVESIRHVFNLIVVPMYPPCCVYPPHLPCNGSGPDSHTTALHKFGNRNPMPTLLI